MARDYSATKVAVSPWWSTGGEKRKAGAAVDCGEYSGTIQTRAAAGMVGGDDGEEVVDTVRMWAPYWDTFQLNDT